MLIVGNALVSEDIIEKKFACNTRACLGACCVQGDAGAPLLPEEIEILESELPAIKPFLATTGLDNIETNGFHATDPEGDAVTTCLPSGECSFLVYDGMTATCGIENAWKAGKTDFQKPVSCHLYPIRAKQYGEYIALNYHRRDICEPAFGRGKKENIPVYAFLKEALIRKMGEEWFTELTAVAEGWVSQKNNR
ncbi:MAG: DUF3109 family protein [Sphingomonadales bacterium]